MVSAPNRVAVCSRSFSRNEILRAELLSRYPDASFNDAGLTLEGDGLVRFLQGHEKAIVALEKIDESVLSRLPELQVISKYGVGLDTIDLAAMRRHGKRLGWTGGVNRRSVAELVMCLAIALLREVVVANREITAGQWRQNVGVQLAGRTFGILGCGHIGKDVVRLLQPFGCRLLAHDIVDYADFYRGFNVTPVGLEELLTTSDIVSVHLPLDRSTRMLLDADRLGLMKPTAVLINTARGGIVDEQALATMLRARRLAAAAFDVFEVEPPSSHDLIALPNFLATPHIGGSSQDAILAMGRAAIEGLAHNEVPKVDRV